MFRFCNVSLTDGRQKVSAERRHNLLYKIINSGGCFHSSFPSTSSSVFSRRCVRLFFAFRSVASLCTNVMAGTPYAALSIFYGLQRCKCGSLSQFQLFVSIFLLVFLFFHLLSVDAICTANVVDDLFVWNMSLAAHLISKWANQASLGAQTHIHAQTNACWTHSTDIFRIFLAQCSLLFLPPPPAGNLFNWDINSFRQSAKMKINFSLISLSLARSQPTGINYLF